MSITSKTSILSHASRIELLASVRDLNLMIVDGRLLEAHDKHYHEDCVQQENEQAPTVGKKANRKREEEWLANVISFRAAEVKSVAVDELNQTTMVEWFFDYTHKEWGMRKYHQVAVQRWRGNKIIHERFYYGS